MCCAGHASVARPLRGDRGREVAAESGGWFFQGRGMSGQGLGGGARRTDVGHVVSAASPPSDLSRLTRPEPAPRFREEPRCHGRRRPGGSLGPSRQVKTLTLMAPAKTSFPCGGRYRPRAQHSLLSRRARPQTRKLQPRPTELTGSRWGLGGALPPRGWSRHGLQGDPPRLPAHGDAACG